MFIAARECVMSEIELKFQVPAGAQAAVRRAVATARAKTVRLQARYFDTPDRRLAQSGIALRLRKEGPAWVQTLKTRGDGVMERGEHELQLPGSREAPLIDPLRHAQTPAGEVLLQALAAAAGPLQEIFATDIRRTRRTVRVPGGQVEIALDQGEIRAGDQRRPVHELEFELVRGAASTLPPLAAKWVRRHGLWLDPRSKAELGDRLARGESQAPALKSHAPALHEHMTGRQAFRGMLASALRQVLGNACELADGSPDPEHLHQWRVGLRRLRCVLRDFSELAGAAAPPQADAWQEELRALFTRLGGARDRDALRESLLPQIAAAGMALADLPPSMAPDEAPAAVVRSAAANVLWLEILETLHTGDDTAAPSEALPLSDRLHPILRSLHRRVAADAATFSALDETAQHRTRKRLKRLRYGAEFCSSLYAPKAVSHYLAALRPAQDALGQANDLVVARALFEPVAADPRACFVLGWLAGRRPAVIARCAAALAQIADTRGFWRRHPHEA